MEYRVAIQGTPNPNALKFILNTPVKSQGNATYKTKESALNNPLAAKLFDIANVTEVYFFDNYITVTQNGDGDWDKLEELLKTIILENIATHDPNFAYEDPNKPTERPQSSDPAIQKIESILDETIRPALQMDGGDLQVVEYMDNVLKVNYQGACGSCPSSSAGTLRAIEGILRDNYNPDIVVELAY